MLETIIKTASIWVPMFLITGAFVIAIIVTVRYKIPALAGRVDKVEMIAHTQQVTAIDMANTVKKHEIYSADGSARYQHAGDCIRFQGTYCKKIDEVKVEVGGIKDQLKEMADARVQESKDLVITMERVKGMIRKDRTEELKMLAEMIVKQTRKG